MMSPLAPCSPRSRVHCGWVLFFFGKDSPYCDRQCLNQLNSSEIPPLRNGCYTACNLLFKRLSLHLLASSPCNWKTFILTEKMCQQPREPQASAEYHLEGACPRQAAASCRAVSGTLQRTTNNILSSICLARECSWQRS